MEGIQLPAKPQPPYGAGHTRIYARRNEPRRRRARLGAPAVHRARAAADPDYGNLYGTRAGRKEPCVGAQPGIRAEYDFRQSGAFAKRPRISRAAGRDAGGGKTGAFIWAVGQLRGAGVHRMARRRGALPRPALDTRNRTVCGAELVENMARVRFRLFQAVFGGVVCSRRRGPALPYT